MPSVTEQAFAVEGGDAPSRNAEHALPGRKLVKTASQVVRDEKIVYVSNLPYQAEVPAIEDIFHKEGVHVVRPHSMPPPPFPNPRTRTHCLCNLRIAPDPAGPNIDHATPGTLRLERPHSKQWRRHATRYKPETHHTA